MPFPRGDAMPRWWRQSAEEETRASAASGPGLAAPAPPVRLDLDAVFRRNIDLIYRICLNVLDGDRDAAADATGAVWEKVVRRMPDDHVRDIDAWLAAVARTTAIDHLRAIRQRARRQASWLDEAFAVEDPASTPEELALDDDSRRLLREQVALLPAAQRQVIELRLDGLTPEEIAQVLGRTRGWVDTTAFRAIRKLRDAMRLGASREGGAR